jgi:hypothetical protein
MIQHGSTLGLKFHYEVENLYSFSVLTFTHALKIQTVQYLEKTTNVIAHLQVDNNLTTIFIYLRSDISIVHVMTILLKIRVTYVTL